MIWVYMGDFDFFYSFNTSDSSIMDTVVKK